MLYTSSKRRWKYTSWIKVFPGQHYTSIQKWNSCQFRFCYFWICIMWIRVLVQNWQRRKKGTNSFDFYQKIMIQKFVNVCDCYYTVTTIHS